MELKSKLSRLRKEKGLTQQALADALHVSRQTVSRWEVGTSIPTLENLIYLSELYQVPLNHLVQDGTPPPKPTSSSSDRHRLRPPIRYLVILGLVLFAGGIIFHSINLSERGPVMDIVNSIRAGACQPVRSAAARNAKAAADSFTEQARSCYGVSATPGGYTVLLSPAVKLRLDYNKWKETQLPQELPGSQGPTEENLAYLRERYSGDLTMFRKVEALDTMFDMGIITREQRNAFYGTIEKTWTAGQAEFREGLLEDGPSTSFSSKMALEEQILYRLSPLARSETLDDLFSWLESDDLFSWLDEII